MENKNSLITVAMLSALSNSKNMDYLDLITPFVYSVLPGVKEKVNIEAVLVNLKENYGFEDLPSNVLLRILSRTSKNGSNVIIKRNKEFFVNKEIDISEFEKNRLTMKENIECIVTALYDSLNKKTPLKNISYELSKTMLIDFLESYGYSTIKDISILRRVTINTDRNNYYVARFILNEYQSESIIFDKILELIKGFLVYNAIYFFSSNQKKDFNSKLKKTEIYLDTSLLIDALGYDTEEGKTATRELISLVKKNGGVVKTFIHNKDEVAGILTIFAKDLNVRLSMRLEFLNSNGYDKQEVLRLRESLDINLEKNGILVVDTPSYGTVKDSDYHDKGYLDLEELKATLEREVSYRGGEDSLAIKNDVESISAISRIREREKKYSIEDCKAIFVTTNIIIINAVKRLYKERFSKGEISFVVSDIDITSLLWLNSFNDDNNIPCLKLIASAYAAHQPSKVILDLFNQKVSLLEKEGNITPEIALIMRTNIGVKNDIIDLTENDPHKITSETIKKIEEKYIDQIRLPDKQKINTLEKEIEKSISIKDQNYLNAETECKELAKKIARYLKLIAKSAYYILLIAGIIITFKTNYSDLNRFSYGIILIIIGIVGFIDQINDKFNYVYKLIYRLENKMFDWAYHKEIKKLDEIFKKI